MGVFDAIIEKYSTANTPVSPLGTFAAIGDAWDKFHSKERGLLPFLADLLFDREAMQRRSERNPVPANAEVLGGTPLPYPGLAGAALDIGMATLPLGAEGVTLASPAWARRGGKGVLAMLQSLAKQAELKPNTPLQEKINAKREVYHATDLEGFKGILEGGEIRPNPWLHQGLGISKQQKLMKAGKASTPVGWANPNKTDFVVLGDGEPYASFADKIDAQMFVNKQNTSQAGKVTTFEIVANKPTEWEHPLNSSLVITKTEASVPGGQDTYKAYNGNDVIGMFPTAQEAEAALNKYTSGMQATNPLAGVSVSRVPRIAPKESKAITFVIDESKLPRSRPLAEEGYRKVIPGHVFKAAPVNWATYLTADEKALHAQALTDAFSKNQAIASNANDTINVLQAIVADRLAPAARPNPLFEYELRTYNEPIPLLDRTGQPVVKEILVDKSALSSGGGVTSWNSYNDKAIAMFGKPESELSKSEYAQVHSPAMPTISRTFEDIFARAFQAGIPVRTFESGPQMHAARAGSYGRSPQGLSFGAHSSSVPIAGGPDPALAKPLTASSLAEQLGGSKPTPVVTDFSKITNAILKAMAPPPPPNMVKEP